MSLDTIRKELHKLTRAMYTRPEDASRLYRLTVIVMDTYNIPLSPSVFYTCVHLLHARGRLPHAYSVEALCQFIPTVQPNDIQFLHQFHIDVFLPHLDTLESYLLTPGLTTRHREVLEMLVDSHICFTTFTQYSAREVVCTALSIAHYAFALPLPPVLDIHNINIQCGNRMYARLHQIIARQRLLLLPPCVAGSAGAA